MLKKILLLTYLLTSLLGFSQLSNKHWLPPLHSRNQQLVSSHYIYLSTPEPVPFQVTIKNGNGTPLAGSPFTISQGNPRSVLIGAQQPSSMFLAVTDVNVVKSDKGLTLEAPKDFYASFRVVSENHAETLILKGKDGLGTQFRVGSLPQVYDGGTRNFVTSFMATEDGTSVTVSDYDTNVVFQAGNGTNNANTQTFNLNKGQTVVLSGYTDTPANLTGFVGALVTSTKPIIVNTGNCLAGMSTETDGQDITLDQIVPIEKVGTEYALVRGNGSNLSEFPLVIATEDNTQIYVNGSTIPLTTLNAGDYHLIQNSLYQGTNNRNMYVTSNKPIYMYQIIAGDVRDATNGLNFIPPLSCFFQKSVDLIPSINQIGPVIYTSDVIALTSNDAVLSINGDVVTELPEPLQGNANWVTYQIRDLIGDISISSTGPLAVGVLGRSGAAGFGGYYSGFGSRPEPTSITICSNNIINLFDSINGNPELGGTWTVPSGGNPIVSNMFNPNNNLPGDYYYNFSKTCYGDTINLSIKITVNVEQAPFVGNNNILNTCKNNPTTDLYSLLGPGAVSGGTWSPALSSGGSIFNPALDSSGTYTYSITGTGICDAPSAEIVVNNYDLPILYQISDLENCDDATDGDDTNGFVNFDLTTKNNDLLGTQTGITVTYHISQGDAILGQNSITNIYSNDRIIYARLTNASNCSAVNSFNLVVKRLPIINNNIVSLKQCDIDSDAVTNFNLTQANILISTDNSYTFSYHNSQNGAEQNNDFVTNETFFNAANGSIVWARVQNTQGCYRVAQVNLIVSTTTINQNYVFPINECDDYIDANDPDADGYDYFNLTVIESPIRALFPVGQTYTFSYFLNQNDAQSELNPITNPTNYRNEVINSQVIWVRIESNLYECAGLGPFLKLIVDPLPNVNLGNDFTICLDPYTGQGSSTINATPSTPGNYSYVWNPTNPAGNSPLFTVSQAGTYQVEVTNTTTSCVNTDTIVVTLSSEPESISAVIISPAFSNGATTIQASVVGGFGVYEYSLDGIVWQSSPIFTNLENGTYMVYVRDILGCGLLVTQELKTITYPNYFTPNNDGYNDVWKIELPTSYEASISIYDRYGKLIKKLNSLNNEVWDGTYNGNLLPSTDYWFRVEYTENNTKKEFKSHFSLKR